MSGDQSQVKEFINGVAQYIIPSDRSPWLDEGMCSGPGRWAPVPELCPWRAAVFPPDLMQIIREKSKTLGRDFIM